VTITSQRVPQDLVPFRLPHSLLFWVKLIRSISRLMVESPRALQVKCSRRRPSLADDDRWTPLYIPFEEALDGLICLAGSPRPLHGHQ
jgi:hypothetical protein